MMRERSKHLNAIGLRLSLLSGLVVLCAFPQIGFSSEGPNLILQKKSGGAIVTVRHGDFSRTIKLSSRAHGASIVTDDVVVFWLKGARKQKVQAKRLRTDSVPNSNTSDHDGGATDTFNSDRDLSDENSQDQNASSSTDNDNTTAPNLPFNPNNDLSTFTEPSDSSGDGSDAGSSSDGNGDGDDQGYGGGGTQGGSSGGSGGEGESGGSGGTGGEGEGGEGGDGGGNNPPPPINEAPQVEAGSNQTITLPNNAPLDATVSDDDLPDGTLDTLWTKESGPGTVLFVDNTAVDTVASFSDSGVYVLQLRADDGDLITTDTVTITVLPQPPALVQITGTIYQSDEVTPLTGSSKQITLRVNGQIPITVQSNAGDASFAIPDLSLNANDVLTLYLEGEPEQANTVTVTDGQTDILQLQLIVDHIVIQSNNAPNPITISDLSAYDSDQNDPDMLFDADVGAPNVLTTEHNSELYIPTGYTFQPGGEVNIGVNWPGSDLDLNGTWIATGTEVVHCTRHWDATGGVFIPANGKVFMDRQTDAFFTPNGSTFYDLEFSKPSGRDIDMIGSATVTNLLTLTRGHFDNFSNSNLRVEGDIIYGANFGGITSDHDGLITVQGSRDQQISALNNNMTGMLGHLTIDKSGGTFTAMTDIAVAASLTYVRGNVDFVTHAVTYHIRHEGTFDVDGLTFYNLSYEALQQNWHLTVNGTLTILNNFSLIGGSLNAGVNGNILVYGDLIVAGAFGRAESYNDGIVTLTGAAAQTLIHETGAVLPGLTINKTNNTDVVTVQGTGPMEFQQDLTLTRGVFDINGIGFTCNFRSTFTANPNATLRLRGNEALTFVEPNGFDESQGTVEFTGGSTYFGLPNGFGDTFYDLRFNGAGGRWILDAPLAVNNDLSLQAGQLDVSALNHLVMLWGNLLSTDDGSRAFFNARQGTFTLAGFNQTLLGSNTFFHLTKTVTNPDTLFFEMGRAQTIEGILTLRGANGAARLFLQSTQPGSQSFLTLINQDNQDLDYLEVTDSNAGGGALLSALNSLDQGNNTNWNFNNQPVKIVQGDTHALEVDQDSLSTDPANRFDLIATDPDAGANSLIWTIDTLPTNGTAQVESGSPSDSGAPVTFSYQPTPGFNSTDLFIIQVDDGNGMTDTITVNVSIPVYVDQNYSGGRTGPSGSLNNPWTFLDEGVTAVQDTGKVIVNAGNYNWTSLTNNLIKQIVLEGETGVTINLTDSPVSLGNAASGSQFSNFTFNTGDYFLEVAAGQNTNDVTMNNITFQSPSLAESFIDTSLSSNAGSNDNWQMTNNTFESNLEVAPNAILLSYMSNLLMKDNVFQYIGNDALNMIHLHLQDTRGDLDIRGNIFGSNGVGLQVTNQPGDPGTLYLVNNTFNGSINPNPATGAFHEGSMTEVLINNLFTFNQSFAVQTVNGDVAGASLVNYSYFFSNTGDVEDTQNARYDPASFQNDLSGQNPQFQSTTYGDPDYLQFPLASPAAQDAFDGDVGGEATYTSSTGRAFFGARSPV